MSWTGINDCFLFSPEIIVNEREMTWAGRVVWMNEGLMPTKTEGAKQ